MNMMRAGNGVWHTGGLTGTASVLGYQLWLALPPELENGPAHSNHLVRSDVPEAGPCRGIINQAMERRHET